MLNRWMFIALLALVFLSASCEPPATPARKAATISRIKNIHHTMQVLEADKHISIGEQLGQITNGTTLQEKWAQLVLKTMTNEGVSEKLIRQQFCCDDYGNPFNIDYKTNLLTHMTSNDLAQVKFDIIVWSSGKNGTNEFGQGDDILLPQK